MQDSKDNSTILSSAMSSVRSMESPVLTVESLTVAMKTSEGSVESLVKVKNSIKMLVVMMIEW